MGEPVNPFLQFGSTMVSTADVLRLSVSTPKISDEVTGGGKLGEYLVILDTSTPAPVLDVTVTSGEPATARRITQQVVGLINSQLAERQQAAGAPRATWLRTTVLSDQPAPTKLLKGL